MKREIFTIETPGVETNTHNFKRKRCEHKFRLVNPHGNRNHIICEKCGNQRNVPK